MSDSNFNVDELFDFPIEGRTINRLLKDSMIGRGIAEKINDFNPTTVKFDVLHVEADQDCIFDYLGKMGKIHNVYSNDLWLFHKKKRPIRVNVTEKGDLSRIFLSIMFSEEEDSSQVTKKKDRIINEIKDKFGDKMMDSLLVDINWYQGYSSSKITEVINDTVYDSAYPHINLNSYVENYLDSQESVLLIKGKPGTGKSRFIRYLLKRMGQRKRDKIKTCYTDDYETLYKGEIFKDFIKREYNMMILEDIDTDLSKREEGNRVMATILNTADGVIRSPVSGKIVLTTNLPNINHIDDALIRPGRCFDVLTLDELSAKEGEKLLNDLNTDYKLDSTKTYTVGEIYEIANEGLSRDRMSDLGIGFKKSE